MSKAEEVDPASRAARLTEKQKKALLWLPICGAEVRPPAEDKRLLGSLRLCLQYSLVHWERGRLRGFRLTPYGRRVRALLHPPR